MAKAVCKYLQQQFLHAKGYNDVMKFLHSSLMVCVVVSCFSLGAPARSDALETSPLAAQIAELQEKMKAQPTAKERVFYITSDHHDDVLKRALKRDKTNFAAMRAASALYRQMAAEYYAQEIRTPGIEAEVMANLYDSLAVLHHPETDAAKTAQAELDTAVDKMLLQTKSEYEAAAPNFTRAQEWKDDGNKQSSKGRLWLAVQRFQKALEVDPKFADAQNNLGSIYQMLNDLPRANAAFHKTIALDSQHRVAYYNLANSYHKAGFDKEALNSADEALQFADSPAVKMDVLNSRAQIRLALNDHAGAMEDWRTQIVLDPQNRKMGLVWSNIGMVALADADIKTAQNAFKNSVDLVPASDMFQTLYAMALNALDLQIAADLREVKIGDLPIDRQNALGPFAREPLKTVEPILGAYRIDPTLLEYWDETIPNSALSKPENAPLLRRCQSVLNALTPRREN